MFENYIGLKLFCLFTFVLLLQGSMSTRAYAQMDWLKKGQEILGTMNPSSQNDPSTLTNGEIATGLKEALRVGTERVVGQLGQTDGFNADPAIHIPLPENLKRVKSALSAVGMAAMMDDLELKLNRAAEEATPVAKSLFWDSIEDMSINDVRNIYNGPNDAATRYFQQKMSDPLAIEMQPIVENALNQVGAVQAYDAVMGQYATLPFVPDVKANINQHVVDKGLEGIFYYIAREEAAIRENPAKRTTEILQKVFGSQ